MRYGSRSGISGRGTILAQGRVDGIGLACPGLIGSGLALWATTRPSTKRLKLLRNVESCINSNPFTTLMTYEDSAESFPYEARIVHTTESFKRPWTGLQNGV